MAPQSKEQLLRDRWKGESERVERVIEAARSGDDWTALLEGLSYIDEVDACPGEKHGRDLRGLDLSHVKEPMEQLLRAANLHSATLPHEHEGFETLQSVDQLSRNARRMLFITIVGCAYSLLSIASTKIVHLIVNSPTFSLPIIRTTIPVVWLYWGLPPTLLLFYLSLHLYMQHMWVGLAELPAVFPDGKPLDRRTYPWLLVGLVRAHLAALKNKRPPLSRVHEMLSIFLAWWLVPLTICAFWLRYLRRQDWSGTSWHILLLLGSILIGIRTYRLCVRTLSSNKTPLRHRTGLARGMVLACLAMILSVSYGVVFAPRIGPDWLENLARRAYLDNADLRHADLQRADLNGVDLTRADLKWADLREADLSRAILVEADLQRASLGGANLTEANLERAMLFEADLREAELAWAFAREADFTKANLGAAVLDNSDCIFANFKATDLRDASLRGAKLGATFFADADLTRADLAYSSLYRARLDRAIGLTEEQIKSAITDRHTLLPDHLMSD